jgi:hypothetical protein
MALAGRRFGMAALIAAVNSGVAVDDLGDLLFGDRADDLIGNLAALENQKCGDATDIVTARRIHVLIDIQLDHLEFAGVVVCDLSHRWRKHMARTAPICPKIHHHRLRVAGVKHLGLKAAVCNAGDILCHVLFLLCLSLRAPLLEAKTLLFR